MSFNLLLILLSSTYSTFFSIVYYSIYIKMYLYLGSKNKSLRKITDGDEFYVLSL